MTIILSNFFDYVGFLCLVSAAQQQHCIHKCHKSTIDLNCGTGVKSQAR